jgi:hypothetical protein
MPEISLEKAEAAKQSALQLFGTIGKIVGVGITRVDGEYAVKVNLSEPVEPGTALPTEIEGVRVRVEITGVIQAR